MFLNNILTHGEFVSGYRSGHLTVSIDAAAAARLLSAKLLLPLMTLPVLGLGVGLALLGWVWSGLAVIAVGIVVPRLIKRSAPHFLLTQALQDAAVYQEIRESGILKIDGSTKR